MLLWRGLLEILLLILLLLLVMYLLVTGRSGPASSLV